MNKNTIPNLTKACEVLRQLAANPDGTTQSEMEKSVGLPRATAFRILNTFCIEGFAMKQGKRYKLGVAMGQIGIKAVTSAELQVAAEPVLRDLANATGETAHLAVPSGHHSLILAVCDSPNPIRVASRPGALADMHCSSTGKVFLAFKTDEDADALISRLSMNSRTSLTLASTEELKKELPVIREFGYAIDDEEYFDGVRCLAAPIRDAGNTVIAAIGITGTASRFTRDRNEEIAVLVKHAAKQMENRISN